jgi:hypothetical protein
MSKTEDKMRFEGRGERLQSLPEEGVPVRSEQESADDSGE